MPLVNTLKEKESGILNLSRCLCDISNNHENIKILMIILTQEIVITKLLQKQYL